MLAGPEGQLLDDIYNKNGHPKYKYFYSAADGGELSHTAMYIYIYPN